MLFDGAWQFNFLEMNTRLQVEHAVTEEVTGIDLVGAAVRLAWRRALDAVLPERSRLNGPRDRSAHLRGRPGALLPLAGPAAHVRSASGKDGIRVETGYAEGYHVTPYYDPMIGKIIAHGPDRAAAIARRSASPPP